MWRFERSPPSYRFKNPKSNYNKTPGYTQDEIDGMNNFIQSGFTDTYRPTFYLQIQLNILVEL